MQPEHVVGPQVLGRLGVQTPTADPGDLTGQPGEPFGVHGGGVCDLGLGERLTQRRVQSPPLGQNRGQRQHHQGHGQQEDLQDAQLFTHAAVDQGGGSIAEQSRDHRRQRGCKKRHGRSCGPELESDQDQRRQHQEEQRIVLLAEHARQADDQSKGRRQRPATAHSRLQFDQALRGEGQQRRRDDHQAKRVRRIPRGQIGQDGAMAADRKRHRGRGGRGQGCDQPADHNEGQQITPAAQIEVLAALPPQKQQTDADLKRVAGHQRHGGRQSVATGQTRRHIAHGGGQSIQPPLSHWPAQQHHQGQGVDRPNRGDPPNLARVDNHAHGQREYRQPQAERRELRHGQTDAPAPGLLFEFVQRRLPEDRRSVDGQGLHRR